MYLEKVLLFFIFFTNIWVSIICEMLHISIILLSLQIYFGLVNLLSTVPILLAAMIYFKEFVEYCTEDEPEGLQLWQVS